MAISIVNRAPMRIVAHAEHLFDRRLARPSMALTCVWTFDTGGRLVSRWRAPDAAVLDASRKPARVAAAG